MTDNLDLKSFGLNEAQLSAIQHPHDVSLQILAGPGSGKTKVLTLRIASLILHRSLAASGICAVTFTNKAAKEMRERLSKLIGKAECDQVRLGTFHSLCAGFLRKKKNATLVGLESNFTICDSDESKKIITTLLKPHKIFLSDKDISLKEATVMSYISRFKAKGITPELLLKEPNASADIDRIVAEVYCGYDAYLRKSNSLDFDDLLVFGVKLFKDNSHAVEWCKHVFVDEFQDTNIIQYNLMKTLASHGCVTIVGDPDQSIYGWRSAEVANLHKMRKDFPQTKQILLQENYRSTAAILSASIAIVAQDKARPQKTLYTSHPRGTIPVIKTCDNEHAEADFIAREIKRLKANMGDVLRYGDFCILLRFNALSRVIESALQKSGIPSKIFCGTKFFSREEIKDLLSYLQVVDNPSFDPAFARAVNVPSRGIGEKTLVEITSRATKTKLSSLTVVERICEGKMPDIKQSVSRKLSSFVKTIRVLRKLASEGTSPAGLISKLLDLVDYRQHLKKTQPDWENRWENVQELITFASEVDADIEGASANAMITPEASLPDGQPMNTPLRAFLQASMLSSEGDNANGENVSSVTISTAHAAKGLEWPVVFVPGVEQGTFPFYRTESIEEERRLLYVACTRAQGLLYLSHASKRRFGAETKTKEISEFVSVVLKENPAVFTPTLPEFSPLDRLDISRVLDRKPCLEADVTRLVNEFNRNNRHLSPPQIRNHFNSNPQSVSSTLASTANAFQTGAVKGILVRSSLTAQTTDPLIVSNANSEPLSTTSTSNLPYKPHPLCHGAPKATPAFKTPTIIPVISPAAFTSTERVQPLAATLNPGVKRRLGMGGRSGAGYANKKFKPPTA